MRSSLPLRRGAPLPLLLLATLLAVALLLAGAVSASSAPRNKSIQVWQTKIDQGQKIASLDPIPINRCGDDSSSSYCPIPSDTSSLRLYPSEVHQSILGFGGAITEASVSTLARMPKQAVEEVIDSYFGKEGNRYSIGRLHINSCDFSVDSWNFDPVPDDFALRHFDMNVTHEQQYLLPFLHRMLNRSHHDVRLFASPWSPPAWMKTNGDMLSSHEPCLKKDARYPEAWAKYLAKWITAFEKQGIPIWGMTPQNEPEFAAPWEACLWSAEEMREWLKDFLGPIMKKEHPDVEIIVFDHNKDHVHLWADVIFGDKEASQYTNWIGVHWYSGDEFDNLNTTHANWPRKHILATEATHVNGVRLGDVGRAESYAHDILGDLNNWVSGWTDWNIVLDETGGPNHLGNLCDAPIIANTQTGELIYQPTFYYLGHFSRFLPPNRTHRIGHSFEQWHTTSNGLELAAFRVAREERKKSKAKKSRKKQQEESDADLVVVLMNPRDYDMRVTLQLAEQHEAVLHIPAHSIQTLKMDEEWA